MPGNPLVRFDEGRVGRTARCRPLSYSTASAVFFTSLDRAFPRFTKLYFPYFQQSTRNLSQTPRHPHAKLQTEDDRLSPGAGRTPAPFPFLRS